MRRFLVATDGSKSAAAAVAHAAVLARDAGAELLVLNVVPRSPFQLHLGAGGGVPMLEVQTSGEGRRLAEAAALTAAANGARAVPRLEHGDPAARIVHVAEGSLCELVVLGAHGRGPASAATLGPVTQAVLAQTRLPVLVVKPGQPRADSWRARHSAAAATAGERSVPGSKLSASIA